MRIDKSKKNLRESEETSVSSVKPFADVQIGDRAVDYAGNVGEVLAKGTAEEMLAYDTTGAMEEALSDGYVDFAADAIAFEIENDGSIYAIVYGSDGAWVETGMDNSRVYSFAFDFVINESGLSPDEARDRILRDIELVDGIQIVGNPNTDPTSWSREEYGLTESVDLKEGESVPGKYTIAFEKYDRIKDNGLCTKSFSAKDDLDAILKIKKREVGPIYGLNILVDDNTIYEEFYGEPQSLEDAADVNGYESVEEYKDDIDIVSSVEEILESIEDRNGDGDDCIHYIKRPDGTYLFKAEGTDEDDDWDDEQSIDECNDNGCNDKDCKKKSKKGKLDEISEGSLAKMVVAYKSSDPDKKPLEDNQGEAYAVAYDEDLSDKQNIDKLKRLLRQKGIPESAILKLRFKKMTA